MGSMGTHKNKEKLSKMKQKETETNSAGEPEIL